MQEAWLLIDEQAIRYAANNPRGHNQLNLPSLSALETQPDPKAILHTLILEASGLSGRRLKNFKKSEQRQAPHRVAQYIREEIGFAALRQLSAFAALEADIWQLIDEYKWR
jgi:hypothetical protein